MVESEVGGHATVEADLASLPIGTAYVWSPRWLKVDGQFKFPLKRTYDAGKTPVRGQVAVALKPIDVGALREAMGEIEIEAKQNDPKALQRRIADLEGQLRTVLKSVPGKSEIKLVEKEKVVYALVREDFAAMDGLVAEVDKQAAILIQTAHAATNALESLKRTVPKRPILQVVASGKFEDLKPLKSGPVMHVSALHSVLNEGNGVWPSEFVGKMKDMVIVLRSWHPRTMNKGQLALMVGMAAGGGGFNNYLGKLRALSVVTDTSTGIGLSDFGSALAPPSPALTPDAIVDLWRPQLPAKALAMLEFLRQANGDPVDKSMLAEAVEMDAAGGGFNNYLGMLRTAGLVARGRDLKVTELLR
jgi:hypothetical protein